MSQGKLSHEEQLVVSELISKCNELSDLDIGRLVVKNRMPGHWYLELAYTADDCERENVAYDLDVVALDNNNDVLGIAMFYNENLPLSKLHVFRYSGSGTIHVALGSIELQ